MAHIIIIGGDGVGAGGSVKSRIEWTPDHALSFEQQGKRVKKAEKLLEKIDDILYAGSGYPDEGGDD